MVAFFCSTVQKFHWLFSVGSLDNLHWVHFKIESVLLKARRKKIKLYNSLRNGSNYSVRQLTLDNSKYKERRGNYLDNTQISSKQW